MDEYDLAWAAGLVDGEGCIRISKTEPNGKSICYDLWLTVAMCDKEPIMKLHNIFELGAIRVDQCPSRRTPIWTWQCSTKATAKIITGIMPWLTCKREEAELALDFVILKGATASPGQRLSTETLAMRDAYYWRMRELKTSHMERIEQKG